MNALLLVLLFGLTACATVDMSPNVAPERHPNASTLVVDANSLARKVLYDVPSESALERFELIDDQGQVVSYVAFTDTAFGGLIFVGGKLVGSVSREHAQLFYSCRGYTTVSRHHWAKDAPAWAAGLLRLSFPVTSVQLDFSGTSTVQSIKEMVEAPLMKQLGSLFSLGSNPFSIFKSLSQAQDAMIEQRNFDVTLLGLRALTSGASEAALSGIVKPEDISFVSGGIIMAYPKYSMEFFVTDGHVKVIQQPSFQKLARTQAALFYLPNVQWARCTPSQWPTVLTPEPTDAATQDSSVAQAK